MPSVRSCAVFIGVVLLGIVAAGAIFLYFSFASEPAPAIPPGEIRTPISAATAAPTSVSLPTRAVEVTAEPIPTQTLQIVDTDDEDELPPAAMTAIALAPAQPPEPPRAPTPRPYSGRSRLTFLFLGVDERGEQAGQPTRTDMMMLARIDFDRNEIKALSIPRDLWVTIPNISVPGCYSGSSSQKITTAHFWGSYCGYQGGGIQLSKDTVEYNLGVKAEHYVRVNFRGFQRLVDALDGIDVYVENEIYDPRCPAGPNLADGSVVLHLLPGVYHMDGVLALQYVRTRNSDSDFGRMHRQQQVMLAMRQKALNPEVWPNVPDIARAMWDAVETDLSVDEMISLIWTGRDVEPTQIEVKSIEGSLLTSGWTADGQSILIADWPAVQRLMQETFP